MEVVPRVLSWDSKTPATPRHSNTYNSFLVGKEATVCIRVGYRNFKD